MAWLKSWTGVATALVTVLAAALGVYEGVQRILGPDDGEFDREELAQLIHQLRNGTNQQAATAAHDLVRFKTHSIRSLVDRIHGADPNELLPQLSEALQSIAASKEMTDQADLLVEPLRRHAERELGAVLARPADSTTNLTNFLTVIGEVGEVFEDRSSQCKLVRFLGELPIDEIPLSNPRRAAVQRELDIALAHLEGEPCD